jgi:hypothetical protein
MQTTVLFVRLAAVLGTFLNLLIAFLVLGIANKYSDNLTKPAFWLTFLLVEGLCLTIFVRLFALRRWAAVAAPLLLILFAPWFWHRGSYSLLAPTLSIGLAFTLLRSCPALKSGF